jgi:hypothetical protein
VKDHDDCDDNDCVDDDGYNRYDDDEYHQGSYCAV